MVEPAPKLSLDTALNLPRMCRVDNVQTMAGEQILVDRLAENKSPGERSKDKVENARLRNRLRAFARESVFLPLLVSLGASSSGPHVLWQKPLDLGLGATISEGSQAFVCKSLILSSRAPLGFTGRAFAEYLVMHHIIMFSGVHERNNRN